MQQLPYRSFSSYLRETFGERVQKITLDAGLDCPNRQDGSGGCIYCNAKGSGTGALAEGVNLEEQIETQIKHMTRRYGASKFLAYFQSYSNTYGSLEKLRSIYDCVLPHDQIVGMAIGTRPDCIDREKLDLIYEYSDKRKIWVEYGLQSANDKTLELINRGHDVGKFVDAVELTAGYGFRICAHHIIGLPNEGMDDWLDAAKLLNALPVTDLKLHLLYVVRGTELDRMYQAGQYNPLEQEEYVEGVAQFIAHLRPDIVVQRITGDPHAAELVAPLWSLEKHVVRNEIIAKLNNLQIRQGSRYATL